MPVRKGKKTSFPKIPYKSKPVDEPWDSDEPITTVKQAKQVCEALAKFSAKDLQEYKGLFFQSPVHTLISRFQDAGNVNAAKTLAESGLPEIIRIYDEALELNDETLEDTLLLALKIFAIYSSQPGLKRVIQAICRPMQPDGYMWTVIFNTYAQENHPLRKVLLKALRTPLPPKFIGVSYLDFANTLARERAIIKHPFDSPEGHARLRLWLTSKNEEDYSYAISATASLPFLRSPQQKTLLRLATRHRNALVRIEAAWAAARAKDAKGIKQLQEFCLNPNYSKIACRYLEELGRSNAIPTQAMEPAFQAMAEMSEWLAHPSEIGRAPDKLKLYDTREIFWPPANDERRLWLIEYHYNPSEEGNDEIAGIGMVGSVTFALFGEVTAGLAPEDVYALHCCWELQLFQDGRAPRQCTIKAGRKLLKIS